MNYDEVAKKLASDHFAREQRGECPIAGKLISDIAAALRRAANEAAWDVKLNQPNESTYAWMEAKYGPRPKENRDE